MDGREQTCGCHREGAEGGLGWEAGVSRRMLIYTERINNRSYGIAPATISSLLGSTITKKNI